MTTQKTEYGFPLLADISGYVPFVLQSEIDHANEIIRELLEFIIGRIEQTFTIAQIDGDSIFAFAPQDRILRGETLLELLENTYTAYKDQLIQVSRVRTCGCNACRNASNLDLKFAVHFGEYYPSEFQNQFDLIGLAPLFVRKREWKRPIKELKDWRGYALFTMDCLAQLGLQPEALGMVQFDSGTTKTFTLNLQSRHESLIEQRRTFIETTTALYSLSMEFPISPTLLWSWINDPDRRNQWFIVKWSARSRPAGRTNPGAVNHCYHGIGDTFETILDWRPFEYYTSEFRIRPFNVRIRQSSRFEPISMGGTRLTLNILPASEPAGWFTKFMCQIFHRSIQYVYGRLNRMVSQNTPAP